MQKESRKQEEGRRRKGNKETKPAGRINHHTAEYCIYLKRNPNPTELDYFHFSDSRFPDLTATECRGARSTCGRVSGLGFFHDSRYGCYVTKGLQDWSSFDLYLVSIDPCISILGASMLNHLEPHPYLLMLDMIYIDG